LAFINNNPNAYLGYTAWSAGAFSATDYNLTLTPKGNGGNLIDQQTLARCVVGTRNNSTTNSTGTKGQGTSSGSLDGSSSVVAVAGSNKLAVGVSTAMAAVGLLLAVVA